MFEALREGRVEVNSRRRLRSFSMCCVAAAKKGMRAEILSGCQQVKRFAFSINAFQFQDDE